jgi:group I intron endonuclease
MIGIYKITSPSGRIYIGQSVNIEHRKSCYKRLRCVAQPRIYNSLIKYGWEKHKFEILEECEILHLNEKERYYQDLYQSNLKKGLNCQLTKATDLPFVRSKETTEKIRIAKLNTPKKVKIKIEKPKYVFAESHRQAISNGNARYWLNKERSEETKLKFRLAKLGTKQTDEAKNKRSKIILDLNTGVFYNSAREVSNLYGIPYSTIKNKLCGSYLNNTSFIYA